MAPIFTIGHSTRTEAEFLSLLRRNGVTLLADVRSAPHSTYCPQFNREAMPGWLAPIEYRHFPALGGHRGKQCAVSANGWWEHPSFRNYADYAERPEFEASLDELIALSRRYVVAYMCAEAHWSKCHRRIITDHLLIREIEVRHILDGRTMPAELSEGAVRFGAGVRYPGEAPAQFTLFEEVA